MTQWSAPWDGLGDPGRPAPYNSDTWDDIWAGMFGATGNVGVLPGVHGELRVAGMASPVHVDPGSALVLGKFYRSDLGTFVPIPTPVGADRIDRITVRSTWATKTVRISRTPGAEGSGTPPALVQVSGDTYDIPLAQVSITTYGAITITDEREFVFSVSPRTRDEVWLLEPTFFHRDALPGEHFGWYGDWLRDGQVDHAVARWAFPTDYSHGLVVHGVLAGNPGQSGTIMYSMIICHGRWGEAICTNQQSFHTRPMTILGDTLQYTEAFTVTEIPSFYDRYLHVHITRQGQDPGDTYVHPARFVGFLLSYVSIEAGRFGARD